MILATDFSLKFSGQSLDLNGDLIDLKPFERIQSKLMTFESKVDWEIDAKNIQRELL